jgi:hypothetical protein
MKAIKLTLMVGLPALFFMAGIYVAGHYQLRSATAGPAPESASPARDLELCQRLIRFGQVAYDRGQFLEAKHFFQKAIVVYPSHVAAWKKYNMALLSLISAKVETDPAFLPELAPATGAPPLPKQQPPASASEGGGC